MHQTLASFRAKLAADDPVADLNQTSLDGRSLTVGELQSAADAMPFLGDRRLVVVDGMLAQTARSGNLADALMAYLPNVPPTTRLVFVEGKLRSNLRVLKWAERWREDNPERADDAVIRRCDPPKPAALPGWLSVRAGEHGGEIDGRAAMTLAEAVTRNNEVDMQLAESELVKLLTYAVDRPVTVDDVAELVTPVSLESVFRLIDALAERDGGTATSLLHRFFDEGEPPLRLLALIARQFRNLAHARGLMASGASPAAIAKEVGVPAFVGRKLASQARRFSDDELAGSLRRLLELDTAIKTGKVEAPLALDLFVAETCGAAGQ